MIAIFGSNMINRFPGRVVCPLTLHAPRAVSGPLRGIPVIHNPPAPPEIRRTP
jgi:hypothetical protein